MHPTVPKSGGVFEGFAVEVTDSRARARVSKLLDEKLGSTWNTRRFGDRKSDYEMTIVSGKLSTRDAWNTTYALRALPGVLYAEPLVATSALNNAAWQEKTSTKPATPALSDAPLPECDNPEWALDAMRVREAWQRFFPDPAYPPGHGIRIGHPDTGYQDHPEIIDSILSQEGYDFLHEDRDAHDDLERPGRVLLPNPGHGTGTSSVIVSAGGSQQSAYPGKGWVTGIAPGARIVPLRAAHSVLLFSTANVSRAIEYAASHDVQVISISLGGLFSWRLRKAVEFAQSRGVIICSAAGNFAPFVGWPAAYDEVIACAASNAKGEAWKWGCRGRAVDVTAPGESVWRACVEKRDGQLLYDVGQGSGTSYATALTAGIAALWLSFHGYENLVNRYGKERLPLVFNRVIRRSCVKFPGWRRGEYGAGLVDAVRLLEAPLPDARRSGPRIHHSFMDTRAEIDRGGPMTFAHLFAIECRREDSTDEARELRARAMLDALSALLGTSIGEVNDLLRVIGQELAFLVASDSNAYRLMDSIIDDERAQIRSEQKMDLLRDYLAKRASKVLGETLSTPKSAMVSVSTSNQRSPGYRM